MKLKARKVIAFRVEDEDGDISLRLDDGLGDMWYGPAPGGFKLLDDEQADELEAAFQRATQKDAEEWVGVN